jgi:hypothetical protein
MAGLGELRQRSSVFQCVVSRFPQAVLRQHRVHGVVEPGLDPGEQRDSTFLASPEPLLIGQVFDLPLDAEELLVEGQRLMGAAGGLQQISGLDEASARMHIAGDFRDLPIQEQRIVPRHRPAGSRGSP